MDSVVEQILAAMAVEPKLNTADVGDATARVLLHRTVPDDSSSTSALLAACWAACRRAREVCEEFLSIHNHCRVSARVCRTAELACRTLLSSVQVPEKPVTGDQVAGASAATRTGTWSR